MVRGKQPVLGPNVVLSKEGRVEEEVVEKSFLQKWVLSFPLSVLVWGRSLY